MTHTSPFRALSQLINRKPSLPAMCILALGLMLASPFTRTASAYNRLEIILDPALTQETSGNGNGIIEFGESGQVGFRVRNRRHVPVYASYIQVDSDEIGVYTFHPNNEYWTEGEEKIIVVQFDLGCSTSFGLTAHIDMRIDWYVPFVGFGRDTGSGSESIYGLDQGNANNFGYIGPPVSIPDNSETGVDIPLVVDYADTITDIDFIINGSSCTGNSGPPIPGLDHPNVNDLVLKLTSPQGTTVTLIDRPGDSTKTGSNFCNTVLDDDIYNPWIQSITSDGAPYPGTFEPANPLSAFIGEDPNGTWTLNVSDHAATNTGQVNEFSLTITDGSSSCDFLSQKISGRVTKTDGTGLSGVRVYGALTDENGEYITTLLPHGNSYTVSPSKLGYRFNPATRYFSVLDTDSIADFVAIRANFSISGRVIAAGTTMGLSGVTMKLTGDRVINVTTDADGNYTFPNLPASGNYTVTPFLIGYKFTSASRSYSTLSANHTGQDFEATVQNYTVGGVVSLGTAGLKGVTITLSSLTPAGFPTQTVTTNSTGAYSFTDVPSGRNYKVTATKEGYQFLPLNKSLTNLSDNQTAVNFAVKVYSISGRVIKSGTTTGISSVKITLTSPTPAGFAARTALTNSTGNYTFTNLPAGRGYTLKPTKTGFTFTPATRSITNLNKNVPAGAATNFTGSP